MYAAGAVTRTPIAHASKPAAPTTIDTRTGNANPRLDAAWALALSACPTRIRPSNEVIRGHPEEREDEQSRDDEHDEADRDQQPVHDRKPEPFAPSVVRERSLIVGVSPVVSINAV